METGVLFLPFYAASMRAAAFLNEFLTPRLLLF